MGLKSRRKHSKKAGTRTSMTWDNVCEMIAYLDFCLLISPDHRRFKDTITAHLEEHTKKWFPFEQIDRKIRKLWDIEGIEGHNQYDHVSIYHYGSKLLHCVQDDPELKCKIQMRVEEIQNDKVSHYAKSETRASRRERTKYHIVLDDFLEHRRRTQRKVSVEVPTHRQRNKKASEPEELEVAPSIDGMSSSPASFHTTTTAPTLSCDERLQTPGEHIESLGSEDENMFALSFNAPTIKQESVQSSSIARRSFALPELSPAPGSRVERWTLFGQFTLQDFQSQVAQLQRENAWHREEVDRLHRVNADLNTKLTATTVSRFGDDTTQQRLIEYQCEVQRLKSIITNKEIFKPFTKPGQKRLNKQERAEIERNMEIIGSDIESVFIFSENMGSCSEVDSGNKTGDLSLLWQRVSGSSKMVVPLVPFQLVLRSLLSAAICMWVFELDFDDTYLANSHLRQTMLSHLRTHDGEEVARDLDLAAHKTLIASEYFKKIRIPLRAEYLASRLSDTLKPLLELQTSRVGSNLNVLAKWGKQQDSVKRIFDTALRIKVAVLVSNDVYEVILPASGDVFDKELMSVEGRRTVTGEHLVRLALAPGLRGFEFDRQQVDYNSFRSPGSSAGQNFDRLREAMVILE